MKRESPTATGSDTVVLTMQQYRELLGMAATDTANYSRLYRLKREIRRANPILAEHHRQHLLAIHERWWKERDRVVDLLQRKMDKTVYFMQENGRVFWPVRLVGPGKGLLSLEVRFEHRGPSRMRVPHYCTVEDIAQKVPENFRKEARGFWEGAYVRQSCEAEGP